MQTRKVIVLPYDSVWKTAFEAIQKELDAAVGDLVIGIEHVGSTSVEGLSAKPCIDIDVVIKDYTVFDAVICRLAKIGYIHEGDLGIKDREAFKYTDKPHLMTHHLYVCPENSKELHRHITFRDFLRNHSDAVKKYGQIKQQAAQLYPDDIDGYIAYKSPCIEELYVKCGLMKEANAVELWDGYRMDGTLADCDLVRSAPIPQGLYHLVSEILVRHTDGDYLLMQRDTNKPNYGGYYEATAGGSALKSEDALSCAIRELQEETGIFSTALTEIGRYTSHDTIYYNYLCITDCDKSSVTLQQGETISYKWVSEQAFIEFVNSDEMIDIQRACHYDFLKEMNYIK